MDGTDYEEAKKRAQNSQNAFTNAASRDSHPGDHQDFQQVVETLTTQLAAKNITVNEMTKIAVVANLNKMAGLS
jgi:DNA-binding FadR family transcriptional regulator